MGSILNSIFIKFVAFATNYSLKNKMRFNYEI